MDLQNIQEQLNTEFAKADVRTIREIMQKKSQKYS